MLGLLTSLPMFAIMLTLAAYQTALYLQQRTGWLLLQPVIVALMLVVVALWLLQIDYAQYRQAADPIALLLGPATVALGVPLYLQRQRIASLLLPILLTLLVGAVLIVALTLVLGWLLGAQWVTLMSLAPKSVTMPIAMLLSEQAGGDPALTAALVMLTGVIGTVMAPPLLRLFKVNSPAARGFTLGMNAHAIGTAYAVQEGGECAAFAALSMSLMGVVTALALPWVV